MELIIKFIILFTPNTCKTGVIIYVGAKPTKLKLNGLEIEVFKTKVKIFDSHGDVSDLEAEKIMLYLYNEGFINVQTIMCEIIEQ
tara:strand:- start:2353 stop:2607 length:255 start_codon:yes stop_codon:yes gene_type:complete